MPTFRWTADTLERSWPGEWTMPLPLDGRSHLVAWVDLDGNGALSTGDRVSRPLDPLVAEAAEQVTFRIDRIFVDPTAEPAGPPGSGPLPPSAGAAPGGGGGPGGPGGPDEGPRGGCLGRTETGLLMGARGSADDRTIEVSASEESSEAGKGRLIIYGFDSAQLNELGLPSENGQPSLVWVNPKKTRRWPVTVAVPIPQDARLRLLPVLDLDGDGRLGGGDHRGRALSLDEASGEQGKLQLHRTPHL